MRRRLEAGAIVALGGGLLGALAAFRVVGDELYVNFLRLN